MHKGRVYPLDQRLRIYGPRTAYPLWFPEGGYTGFATTYRSPDWSGPITFNGPWVLTGWSYGDRTWSFDAPPISMNGHTVGCKYHWELSTDGTAISANLDLYVDGVQQIRSTPSTTPPSAPAPQGYGDTFQFASPANPFKCQLSACVLAAVGY